MNPDSYWHLTAQRDADSHEWKGRRIKLELWQAVNLVASNVLGATPGGGG